MSTDSAISIAWDITKYAVVPIQRHFGYVVFSRSHARELQAEVKKLQYQAHRIRNATRKAKNNNMGVYDQITEWQGKAKTALEEAQHLLSKFEEATKTCCYGTLPDPNCRYQFSRDAKDKIEDIRQLLQEEREFGDICFNDPAPEIMIRDAGIIESRACIILNIMEALVDDSKSVVGVYGLGGVGKSTLVEDVARIILKQNLFDQVPVANVSQTQDIKRIQEEIAKGLNLDMTNKEFESVRAKDLCKRLNNEEKTARKVLIILDDLWGPLELKKVGIPCGRDNKVRGCKLLLTSRDRDVWRRGMGYDIDFPLGELREEEAKRLFDSMVGDKVQDEEFKPLVDRALHKCAGLPFLIVEMAKFFKDAGLSEWKNEMSKNERIGGLINNMLQPSYDNLKREEVKSLLRLCCLWCLQTQT